MKEQKLLYALNAGVDTYNPPIVGTALQFVNLLDLEPRLNRLFTSRGFSQFQDLSDPILGFGHYSLSNYRFSNFYAFSKTSIYRFDFSAEEFDETPIYSGFPSTNDPYVVLPWYNCLYVTKPGAKYVKVAAKTATEVADAPSARYGIIANSHAYLGNISDQSSRNFLQLRWSDLDAPESFDYDPEQSEADFFDLEPPSFEITGISYQRGSPLAYTESVIWIGQYDGFPGSFSHRPLFPGLGSIFHNSVVSFKEIDYFIGPDNIYRLNGFQVESIGDQIWERFINDVKIESTTIVPGYINARKDQVFWVYKRNDDSFHSIVYNYKENKWSERDPQQLTAWIDTPRVIFRGFDVIDDISDTINDVDDLIDDPNAGYPLVLPQLAGAGGVVAEPDGQYLKLDGTAFEHTFETFDLHFDNVEEVKEFTKVVLEFTGSGLPEIKLELGTRDAQHDDLTWSDPIQVVVLRKAWSFFFRTESVGKFIRFRFTWGNDATNYVDDLRLVSITQVDHGGDQPDK